MTELININIIWALLSKNKNPTAEIFKSFLKIIIIIFATAKLFVGVNKYIRSTVGFLVTNTEYSTIMKIYTWNQSGSSVNRDRVLCYP